MLKTAAGDLHFMASAKGLAALSWHHVDVETGHPQAEQELKEYFAGERRTFNVALDIAGTPFQQRVWQAVAKIPYGETRSYAEIAAQIGSGPRAVGNAVGANKIPIIIPCHRVLASNGMGGYSGGEGLKTKRFLLELEGALA